MLHKLNGIDKLLKSRRTENMNVTQPGVLKFILVGTSGVGKTCLLSRFIKDDFMPEYVATVGVAFEQKSISIGAETYSLQIWDTAGQELYHSITRKYYRDADCAIVVYDITNRHSFQSVESWIRDVKSNAPIHCKIVIVGNKLDRDSQREVSSNQGRLLADEYNAMFWETSAATGQNVRDMFEEGADQARRAASVSEPSGLKLEPIVPGKDKKAKRKKKCCK